jgi:hypothetical protein
MLWLSSAMSASDDLAAQRCYLTVSTLILRLCQRADLPLADVELEVINREDTRESVAPQSIIELLSASDKRALRTATSAGLRLRPRAATGLASLNIELPSRVFAASDSALLSRQVPDEHLVFAGAADDAAIEDALEREVRATAGSLDASAQSSDVALSASPSPILKAAVPRAQGRVSTLRLAESERIATPDAPLLFNIGCTTAGPSVEPSPFRFEAPLSVASSDYDELVDDGGAYVDEILSLDTELSREGFDLRSRLSQIDETLPLLEPSDLYLNRKQSGAHQLGASDLNKATAQLPLQSWPHAERVIERGRSRDPGPSRPLKRGHAPSALEQAIKQRKLADAPVMSRSEGTAAPSAFDQLDAFLAMRGVESRRSRPLAVPGQPTAVTRPAVQEASAPAPRPASPAFAFSDDDEQPGQDWERHFYIATTRLLNNRLLLSALPAQNVRCSGRSTHDKTNPRPNRSHSSSEMASTQICGSTPAVRASSSSCHCFRLLSLPKQEASRTCVLCFSHRDTTAS